MQESVGVNHLSCGFRIFVVTFHGVVPPVAHFALYAHRTFFSGSRVDYFHFREFKVMSYSGVTYFRIVVNAAVGHTR